MNRRNFLSTLIGGLAATAAVRSFPFRVFSFPSEIAIPSNQEVLALQLEKFADHIPDMLSFGWACPTLSLYGLIYDPDFYNATGDYMGIRRHEGPYPRFDETGKS